MRILNYLNRPQTLRAIHGGFVIFWIMLWIVASITGWIHSVTFISHLSIIALILASAASWQGARTEVKEDEK